MKQKKIEEVQINKREKERIDYILQHKTTIVTRQDIQKIMNQGESDKGLQN